MSDLVARLREGIGSSQSLRAEAADALEEAQRTIAEKERELILLREHFILPCVSLVAATRSLDRARAAEARVAELEVEVEKWKVLYEKRAEGGSILTRAGEEWIRARQALAEETDDRR